MQCLRICSAAALCNTRNHSYVIKIEKKILQTAKQKLQIVLFFVLKQSTIHKESTVQNPHTFNTILNVTSIFF